MGDATQHSAAASARQENLQIVPNTLLAIQASYLSCAIIECDIITQYIITTAVLLIVLNKSSLY